MTWKLQLGIEPAMKFDRGSTALQAARMALNEFFPQHAHKTKFEKRKSKYVAEVRVEDIHIRVEPLNVAMAA